MNEDMEEKTYPSGKPVSIDLPLLTMTVSAQPGTLTYYKKFSKAHWKYLILTWVLTLVINIVTTFMISEKLWAVFVGMALSIIPFWLGGWAIQRYISKETL
jgi:uncharacterized membrane protein YccC